LGHQGWWTDWGSGVRAESLEGLESSNDKEAEGKEGQEGGNSGDGLVGLVRLVRTRGRIGGGCRDLWGGGGSPV
jgi:hypothetical protein